MSSTSRNLTCGALIAAVVAASAGFLNVKKGGVEAFVGSVKPNGQRGAMSESPSAIQARVNTMSRPEADRDPVYSMINRGASIDQAIAAVVGPGNTVTDPRLVSLITQASLICSQDPDPQGALSQTGHPDPTRAWAVARLLSLCAGFDASKYTLASTGPHLAKVLRDSGADVAAAASMDAVRTATDSFDIVSAGQILLETGQLPLDKMLPNASREYGTPEIMTAWVHATTLLTCHEAGGCGPNSLEVAAFCTNAGCPQGVSMAQAMQNRLPSRDYRAVMAFYSWLGGQRM
jgi:hypothetical protein